MINQHFSELPTVSIDMLSAGDRVSVIDLRPHTEISIHTGVVVDVFAMDDYDSRSQTSLSLQKVVIESDTHRVEYFASDIGLCRDPFKNVSPHMFTVREGDEPETAVLAELARMKLQLHYRRPIMVWSMVR